VRKIKSTCNVYHILSNGYPSLRVAMLVEGGIFQEMYSYGYVFGIHVQFAIGEGVYQCYTKNDHQAGIEGWKWFSKRPRDTCRGRISKIDSPVVGDFPGKVSYRHSLHKGYSSMGCKEKRSEVTFMAQDIFG
jgi:hypothetical protein